MSIKNKINALVESKQGTLRINNVSTLIRWTETAIGDECDSLEIRFDYITGVPSGTSYTIKSRDYSGIIDEIESCTYKYFKCCAGQTVDNIRNGYCEIS